MRGAEEPAVGGAGRPDLPGPAGGPAPPPLGSAAPRLVCNRCHFPVASRAMGCKNPCPNCGTMYPLGDCSD